MLTYNRKQNRVGQDVSFAEILIIFNHFFINFMSFIRNLNEFHCNLFRLFIKKLGIFELLINLGYFSKCMYCFNHKHVSGYFCLLLVKKLHLLWFFLQVLNNFIENLFCFFVSFASKITFSHSEETLHLKCKGIFMPVRKGSTLLQRSESFIIVFHF